MNKVFYNKLVRDHIKEKIEGKGESCSVRVIEDAQEFQQELLKKVVEEAQALAHTRTREEFLNEYADLMVVLDTLTNLMEFSEADIETALAENVESKGLYQERHFLHWSADVDYQSNETPQGVRS
jgi:predicted house-cleaning noncanonical NTP pyrophosphatase (MazG superfamily)